MSRGTFIYVVMLSIFGTGLWAILSFGSILLRAPEDLSGEWQLFEPNSGPDADPVKSMSVEQSGKFFKVRLNGDVLDMKLIQEHRDAHAAHERVTLVLNGRTSRLTFQGTHRSNTFDVSATGAISGAWLAKRASRPEAAPKPAPTTAPAHATTSHARL